MTLKMNLMIFPVKCALMAQIKTAQGTQILVFLPSSPRWKMEWTLHLRLGSYSHLLYTVCGLGCSVVMHFKYLSDGGYRKTTSCVYKCSH